MLYQGFLSSCNYGQFTRYHGDGGGMFFMMGFGALILLVIVFMILRMTRQNTMPNAPKHDNSALNILDERFAKGEISEEEYTKVKTMLKK
ncbi:MULTISPECIES: SHOCT domain-containing protein [Clostridium]|nr:hypothetical protein CUB90_00340 [Clostridium sp. CT7]